MNASTKGGLMTAFRRDKLLVFNMKTTVALIPVLVTAIIKHLVFGVDLLSLLKAVANNVADAPNLTTTSSVMSDGVPDITCTAICPVTVMFLVLFVRVVTSTMCWRCSI